MDYDIYVDDADKNIEKVYNAGKIGLLYNQAWNRDMKEKPWMCFNTDGGMIKRVYNMYHVIDTVRNMNGLERQIN